ncbi:MAG: glycosyltransferase family 2 protein [Pseudomonadota bacterium]
MASADGVRICEDPQLSIVVPVLNEEDAIPVFLAELTPVLDRVEPDYEVIFVDDGSIDQTKDAVRAARRHDARIKLISLSRTFGKEAGLTAGLDFARGAAVVPMDCDLQDPPELLEKFVTLWHSGYDIVYGQRIARATDSTSKRVSADLFYRLFNSIAAAPIEENAGDFRLMNRAAVDATLQLRERNRFMKGLFAWVGFRSIAVPYERQPRAAGKTKFNYWRLWNFALDGITSFSTLPLRIWSYVGGLVALGAIGYTLVLIAKTLIFGRDVPGYASLMVVILILGAVQLISLGVIGEYLGRLYLETKQRPIYLVRSTEGIAPRPRPARAQMEWVPQAPDDRVPLDAEA